MGRSSISSRNAYANVRKEEEIRRQTTITVENVYKTYDSVQAVAGLSFEAKPGEILGLSVPMVQERRQRFA